MRYTDPAGRERSRTFRRKVDAERSLIHVERQKQRVEWIDPERSATRFGEWAAQWLATGSHINPKTRADYESLFCTWVLPASATRGWTGSSRWRWRPGSLRCGRPGCRRLGSARRTRRSARR